MKKKSEIYLGDKIKTTDKFKPLDKNDNPITIEEGSIGGIVVMKRGNFYGIDFEKEYAFTHYLDDLLPKRTGYALEENEFIVVDSYKNDDKDKEKFVKTINENNFESLKENKKEIKTINSEIESKEYDIKNYFKSIKIKEKEILENNIKLAELREAFNNLSCGFSVIEKQYDKLIKNKLIKTIEIIEKTDGIKAFLITTEDLKYSCSNRDVPSFILGAYKILIPFDINQNIMAINYKKHVNKNYSHPCIHEAGKMCLGAAMISEVEKLRKQNKIVALIHLVINWIQEPDYGTPYLDARYFSCAQPVTIRPRDVNKWFSNEYWRDNESWNNEKYVEESNEVCKKYSGNFVDNNQEEEQLFECPECGVNFYLSEHTQCPECGCEF